MYCFSVIFCYINTIRGNYIFSRWNHGVGIAVTVVFGIQYSLFDTFQSFFIAVHHSIYAFLRKFAEYALPIIPTISGSNQRFHLFFLFVHPRLVFIGCPPLHIRCRIVLLIICLGNPIFTVNADLSTVCILIENICAGCISRFGC